MRRGERWLPKVAWGQFCPSQKQIDYWSEQSAFAAFDTIQLLQRIDIERYQRISSLTAESWDFGWLLPYRAEIRRVIDRPDIARIMLYLAVCSRDMTPFGVWLLGQCADRFRLHNLRYFCGDPSPKVRKHVARALERLEAWHLLAAMAKAFPDDADVQRIAFNAQDPVNHAPFADRLNRFKRNVDHSHAPEAAGPSRMPYWSLYNPWQGRPAKSSSLIRRILWHIRNLLRGNGTAH